MSRDLMINVLLVIAGILLAIVLFAAGARWRSRIRAQAPRTSMHDVRVPTKTGSSLSILPSGLPPYLSPRSRSYASG